MAEAAHKRHTDRLRDVEQRLEELLTCQQKLSSRVTLLSEATPVTKLSLTFPQFVTALVVACSLVAAAVGLYVKIDHVGTTLELVNIKTQGLERSVANLQGKLEK